MIRKKVLIIGYGSIGRRHAAILKKKPKFIKNIYVLTKQNCEPFKRINSLQKVSLINPDYVIVSSPSSEHYKQLQFLEKTLSKKLILVEKPLFTKNEKLSIKKNKVFVGYNMRFNPLIQFIRKKIKNKKIWSINIFCGSYLPNWRPNRDYKYTASAKRKLGGGVILDLSHELDYTQWLLGNIKIENVVSKKLSNLKIDTDDFLSISGKANGSIRVQIDLNYFTKKETRKIIIDGENISINADLIKNKIFVDEKNKKSIFSKPNLHKNISYEKQHISLLNNDFKVCCNYKEGKKLMVLISKIKKFSKAT